jgi:hypothetical protein
MLPEKLHIEQISRFHKVVKDLDEKIDNEKDEDKQLELLIQYRKLVKLWSEIDSFVENIKTKLDVN